MKKLLLRLLVVIVVLVFAAGYFLGNIVKAAVEKAGPVALGVPVKLESAKFQLLRGHVSLKGFALGNPEGFSTEKAIGVGEVTVLPPAGLVRREAAGLSGDG